MGLGSPRESRTRQKGQASNPEPVLIYKIPSNVSMRHSVNTSVSIESPLLIQSLSKTAKATVPSRLDFSLTIVDRGTFGLGVFQS